RACRAHAYRALMENRTCGSTDHKAVRSRRPGGNAWPCLEQSMGKKLRSREARRRDVDRVICAVLEAHSKRDVGPRAVERYDDFKAVYRDKIKALRGYALRAPEDWRCRIKSRSEERRFIDLLRFSFARYRVAAHLENAWIDIFTDDFVDRIGELPDIQPIRG